MQDILKQLKRSIDERADGQDRVIIAIDGNCTAGKTTLAGLLAQHFDCNIFHMDDFFLRPEQRTPLRYAETGGNVDYERFQREVLVPLKAGIDFSYRPFDCKILALGQPVDVVTKKLNIVEGTYAMHPYFSNPYYLSIFLCVDPEVQRQRILKRPAHLHRKFFEEWIPMEQRYFDELSIQKKCDFFFTPSA